MMIQPSSLGVIYDDKPFPIKPELYYWLTALSYFVLPIPNHAVAGSDSSYSVFLVSLLPAVLIMEGKNCDEIFSSADDQLTILNSNS